MTEFRKTNSQFLITCISIFISFNSCMPILYDLCLRDTNYKRPSLKQMQVKYLRNKEAYDSIVNFSFLIVDKLLDTSKYRNWISFNSQYKPERIVYEVFRKNDINCYNSVDRIDASNEKSQLEIYMRKFKIDYIRVSSNNVTIADKIIQRTHKGYFRCEEFEFVRNGEKCDGDSIFPNVYITGKRD